MNPFRTALLVATLSVLAPAAQAQQPPAQPYGIATFGEFRKMAMQRDYGAKAVLGKVIESGATDGVGAVSGARGEVTILDGKPIVSYGAEANNPAAMSENAMLLATATVRDWQEVPVTRDVAPTEIERFLADAAKAHGIDPEKSFAFRLRGTLVSYIMHVTAGPSEGHPPLTQSTRKGDAIAGLVVGLYVAPPLVGIATHPGERTHAHWISEDRTRTEHLDAWGIRPGAVLLLPKP